MAKKVLFKSVAAVTGLLLQINLLWAQVLPVTLHVETAGTLPSLIAEDRKYEITDLTLTGSLNGTDIRYIREMAGKTYDNEATQGKLAVLNLIEADIVSGGENYTMSYNTSNNSISRDMFSYCTRLASITIPNSVTSIGKGAFYGCTGLTSITIPYSVTSIADFVFIGCTSLTSITISQSVTSIGEGAFYGCASLTEIRSKNPIPPIANNAFGNVDKAICKLYVPKGSYAAYKDAAEWSDFVNIIEEDASAISSINRDNISIYSSRNGISIATKEAIPVMVYNLSGQKVYQSVINGNTDIFLNKGVYIVSVKNESEKVIVK